MSTTEKAVETATLRARTGAGINWVGAFLLYSKGSTLQEISDQMAIPIAKVKNRFREDDWEGLVKMNREFQLSAPPPATATTTAIELSNAGERIKQNREDGLAVIQGLRSHIRKILDAFAAGDVYLPPNDIKTLAAAATQLNTGSMLALGDDPSPKLLPPPADPNAGPTAAELKKDKRPTMIFNIRMPTVAQAPRAVRSVSPAGGAPHEGTQVDAVLTPMPRREMKVEPVESEVVELESGRASVNFDKLAANTTAPEKKKGASGIPAFFGT